MLEDYIKELEQDLKIDELHLKDYQLRLPALKHKWSGRLIRLKSSLQRDRKEKETLKNDIISEINATSPIKLTQPALASTADRHSKIQAFNDKIKETELLIDLLEKSEKILSSMTFDIKNVIEIMRLELT